MRSGPLSHIILEDVIGFLKQVPPFGLLEEGDIQAVARNVSMEFYPRDAIIMKQDGPPSEALRIIKKGSVKITLSSPEGADVVIDFRGEGDTFGFLSLVGKDRVRSNVIAVEDTICYLLGKEMVLKLLDSHKTFTEHFLKSHIARYIDKTYQEMQDRTIFYGGSDRLLFTTRVGDMGVKEAVTTEADATIREAAQRMAERRVSSVVITDRDQVPVGIVTDRDLRDKVVSRARDVNEPVRNIMSTSLIRVDSRDHCFEAVLKMIRYHIHHVIIVREGRLAGVLTNHDLMILQGTSPLSLTKDIESQRTLEGLTPVSQKINGIVGLLLKEGARAWNITNVITELNDRLVRKVLEIAERRLGPPPVPYCWIGFGSEGRREQTFRTDQDNALIFADDEGLADEETSKYFEAFAAFAQEALLRCGFPPCQAGYMASNALWRQPLHAWKQYFSGWVAEPTPEALIHLVAFFDFRPLHGELSLADALRAHLLSAVKNQKVFFGHVANMAIRNRPPIGFLKSFVVEKDGAHKDELNLKVRGLAPLVDLVRLFALELGVRETATIERIEVLRSVHTIAQEFADELEYAFEFLMLLRIHHQYAQLDHGVGPHNFINPNQLSNLEKRSIKEAFDLIEKIQDLVIDRYKTFIW